MNSAILFIFDGLEVVEVESDTVLGLFWIKSQPLKSTSVPPAFICPSAALPACLPGWLENWCARFNECEAFPVGHLEKTDGLNCRSLRSASVFSSSSSPTSTVTTPILQSRREKPSTPSWEWRSAKSSVLSVYRFFHFEHLTGNPPTGKKKQK